MRLSYVVLGISIVIGCSSRQESNTSDRAIQDSSADAFSDDKLVLLKNETAHNFSSPTDKDTFKIYVTGLSITEGHFRFQIFTKDNRIIYDERLPTTWLLDYGAEFDITERQKENYVKKRVENFFKEENFLQPAIPETDRFEADYSDKTVWDNIKSDSTAIGFNYLVGKEDGRRIAYSKKLKKVVLYYNCC